MDYIEQVSAGMFDHASDSIDKAEEEHGEVNTSLPIETDEKEVEPGEDVQDFADQGLESPTVDEKAPDHVDENPDAQYTRTTAFNAASGEVELETPEDFDKAETAKERLAELRSVNEELERQGDKRRYVAAKTEAPDTAQLYEDDFGKYYYKQIEVDIRPSDIASFADVKAVVALSDDDLALKTIEFLSGMYADPLIDASTEKAATTWLERHLVLTDNDPGSNDTFSHEFKSRIAGLIAQAGSPEGDSKQRAEDKQNVPDEAEHYTDPDDIPDDYTTVTGPQGGTYGVPPGAQDDQGGDSREEDRESVDPQELDQSPVVVYEELTDEELTEYADYLRDEHQEANDEGDDDRMREVMEDLREIDQEQRDREFQDDGGDGSDGGDDSTSPADGDDGGAVTADEVDQVTVDSLAENVGYDAQEHGQDPQAAAERFYQEVERGEDLAQAFADNVEGMNEESAREVLDEEFGVPYDDEGGVDDNGGSEMISDDYKETRDNVRTEAAESIDVDTAEDRMEQELADVDWEDTFPGERADLVYDAAEEVVDEALDELGVSEGDYQGDEGGDPVRDVRQSLARNIANRVDVTEDDRANPRVSIGGR